MSICTSISLGCRISAEFPPPLVPPSGMLQPSGQVTHPMGSQYPSLEQMYSEGMSVF